MKKTKVYLASKSPRRSYLLRESGFDVTLLSISVDESYPSHLVNDEIAAYISEKKANACLELLQKDQIGITADTIVSLNGKILEKPENIDDAVLMLNDLGGNVHQVYTGVSIINNKKIDTFVVKSDVFVDSLNSDEIDHYIKEYKPFDKAGSYGIQEWFGWVKISKIEGSYSNIMGLPMREVYNKIKNLERE